MAAYITFEPKDYYNTVKYTSNGTAIGSGGLSVTGYDFTPTWLWLKVRNADESWGIYDSVSGVTEGMRFNGAEAIVTQSEGVTAFNSDGFTCGNQSRINASNGTPQIGFGFGGGTTAVPSGGSITPSACNFSANAGWGIYKYAGNSTDPSTIAHGLSSAPRFIIVKRTNGSADWYAGSESFTSWSKYIKWDANDDEIDSDIYWGGTAPTSSVVTVGEAGGTNATGGEYLLYAFSNVKGYQDIGKYKGNGSSEGPTIVTGFRPALVVIRRTDGSINWVIMNDKVEGRNPDNSQLKPNSGGGEVTSDYINILSNGFRIINSNVEVNVNNGTYFYWAVAKNSIVSSNNIPSVAR